MNTKNMLKAIVVVALSASWCVAQAVTLDVGNFGMKLTGFAYYDDPNLADNVGPDPANPIPQAAPAGWTGSGRTWGLAEITGIHSLTGANNPDQPTLSGLANWNPSANDRLFVRFGGSIADYNCTAPGNCAPVGAANPTSPYDTYFVTDAGNYIHNGGAYLQVFHYTGGAATDPYLADYTAGPSDGQFGNFGANMASSGSLWLDMVMTPGILSNLLAYGDVNATPDVVEKTTVSSLTTGASTMYADIVGGTAMDAFLKGVFPVADPSAATRADIRIQSNLIAQYLNYNPFSGAGNEWTDPAGWTSALQDPVTGSIPEPASLALLGLGLVGLAGIRRRTAA